MREVRIGRATLRLVQGDITTQEVDAIVNAANSSLRGGSGVDGAIHRAGGPAILEECIRRYPDGCPTGEARITGGGNLRARHVIHTVGPVWHGGGQGEAELLAAAYRNSLLLAEAIQLSSIAFPSLSTGAFGYPLSKAAPIALGTVIAHLRLPTIPLRGPSSLREVRFVLFDAGTLEAYERVLDVLEPS